MQHGENAMKPSGGARRWVWTVLLVLVPTLVHAGAADAEIDCKSEDGSTLQGIIPRDGDEFDVTFSDGSHNRRWADSRRVAAFNLLEDGLLAFETKSDPRITFMAIPRSIRVKGQRHKTTATFEAKVTVPAKLGAGVGRRQLTMACSYLYEV